MAPLQRFYNLSEEKRNLILQVARKEFSAFGFEKASLNQIIKESKISKGAMYYYFADKDDLFSEVVEQTFLEVFHALGPLPEPLSSEMFWKNFEDLVERSSEILFSQPEYASLGRALYSGGNAEKALETLRIHFETWLEQILQKGQSLGAIRCDLPLGMLGASLTGLFFGLDRWFVKHLNTLTPQEFITLVEKSLSLCRELASPKERSF